MLREDYDSLADYLQRNFKGTLKELSDHVGISEGAISRIRSAQSEQPKLQHVQRIAKFFHEDIAEMYRLAGYEREAEEEEQKSVKIAPSTGIILAAEEKASYEYALIIPVVGRVSAGPVNLRYIFDNSGFPAGAADEHMKVPKEYINAYGLRIEGDSLEPACPNGTKIVALPNSHFMSKRLHVIRAKDGRTWVKYVEKHNETYILRSTNARYDIITINQEDIEWIHLVKHIELP